MPVRAFALVLLLALASTSEAAPRSTITVVSIKDAAGSSPPSTSSDDEQPKPKRKKTPAKKAAAKPEARPPVELVSINRHASFRLKPGPQGGFTKNTMRALARFLRCHHTQRVHSISERLARLLYETASHFGFTRLEVVAGYRAPKVAREKGNPKSPHMHGVACDFRIPGVTNEVVRDFVRHFPHVGVGYYPNSGFVHLDVRSGRSAFWVDYSAPGERARYSATPDEDVRKGEPPSDTDAEGEDPQGNAGPGAETPNPPPAEPPSTEKDK